MRKKESYPFYNLSPLEREVFDFCIVRAEVDKIHGIEEAISYGKTNSAKLIIFRCPTNAIHVVHHLESLGARMMDTLLTFSLNRKKAMKLLERSEIEVDVLKLEEKNIISEITRKSFHDYQSHFYLDPKLDKKKCDEFYEKLALKYVSDINNFTFVTRNKGIVDAFLTVGITRNNVLEGLLAGASSPATSGYYLVRALIINAINYGIRKKTVRMEWFTLLNNVVMRRLAIRLGFEISCAKHTFHYWLD